MNTQLLDDRPLEVNVTLSVCELIDPTDPPEFVEVRLSREIIHYLLGLMDSVQQLGVDSVVTSLYTDQFVKWYKSTIDEDLDELVPGDPAHMEQVSWCVTSDVVYLSGLQKNTLYHFESECIEQSRLLTLLNEVGVAREGAGALRN